MPNKFFIEANQKLYGLFILAAFLLILVFLWVYLEAGITGHAIVSLKAGQHYANQVITGTVDLNFKNGEFLPAQTIVKGEFAEKEKSFTLEQLIILSGAGIEKKQGNFSVKNIDITGYGEGYEIAGGGEVSFNLSDFNLKAEEEGKYDLVISLAYNNSIILEKEKKITIKTCEPDWMQYNTSCIANDEFVRYYKDSEECYKKTGQESYLLERPENISYSCDYCQPNWMPRNASCMNDDTKVVHYEDDKDCYSKTGVGSDLIGRPENVTLSCDYCEPDWMQYNISCMEDNSKIEYYIDSNDCYSKTGLDSDLAGRPENATYQCDFCTPSWHEANTSCNPDDTLKSYFIDSNSCYEKTSLVSDLLDKPNNKTFSCDFCQPNWTAINTSCLKGDFFIEWYKDLNSCYELTGMNSDLVGRPVNITHKFACDYEGNNILGDISNINTTIRNLTMLVAKSINLTKLISGVQEVSVKDNGSELLEFRFNFSAYNLNLANLTIKKQAENASKGFVVVEGINISGQNETKSIWLDRISDGSSVCIKDEEGADAGSITAGCNGTSEILIKCPGSVEEYACEFSSNLEKYKISGLRHSAIVELPSFCGDGACNGGESCSDCSADCSSCPVSPSSGGGGSSNGGGGSSGGGCTPKWECSEWSDCVNDKQTRTCINLKAYCPIGKPAEEQACEMIAPSAPVPGETKENKNETQLTAEAPATRPGLLGGAIGVIAAMPLGFRISIALTFLSLIFMLVALIIFIMLSRRKREDAPARKNRN